MQLRLFVAALAATACARPQRPAPEPTPTPVTRAPEPAATPAPAPVPAPAPTDLANPPPDALRSPLGVPYVVLQAAPAGAVRATVTDTLTAHYTGWLADGTVFDSSAERGVPLVFEPAHVIEGWRDVLPLMSVGDRWKIWVPEALAYKGMPDFPAGTLIFEIELLAATPVVVPPPIDAPPDVAKPPRTARRTRSGLRYRFLAPAVKKGPRATLTDEVEVHYTGWTTDGKMFDSSVARGAPATFPVEGVIPGFREGIMLMRRGDRLRVWIPQELAYDGSPGAPAGMLVFDVELLNITASTP